MPLTVIQGVSPIGGYLSRCRFVGCFNCFLRCFVQCDLYLGCRFSKVNLYRWSLSLNSLVLSVKVFVDLLTIQSALSTFGCGQLAIAGRMPSIPHS